MDGLEKFMRENREEFNTEKIDADKLWEGIEEKMPQQKEEGKVVWMKTMLRIAAAVLLFLGISFVVISIVNTNKPADIANESANHLDDINAYYTQVISEKVAELEEQDALTAEDKVEFLASLQELDKENELLMQELKENLDSEQVLEAIVENHMTKLRLLEDFLYQLKQSKKETDENVIIL